MHTAENNNFKNSTKQETHVQYAEFDYSLNLILENMIFE